MGTTVFVPGLLPVIHGNTSGNTDTQLGTGGPLVLDPSTALIVLALFGALGFLALVLSCTVFVFSLTVAAQSTHKNLSTRTFAHAVTALFRCINWIVLAVYAVCRHVYRLARVVYRASPLKHAVAIFQDVYFAALAVLNIVWQAGEAVIFALYLTGLVISKLALVILRVAQAAHAFLSPLISVPSPHVSTSVKVIQYTVLHSTSRCLSVRAYSRPTIRFVNRSLCYLRVLSVFVGSVLAALGYTLLAFLAESVVYLARQSSCPPSDQDYQAEHVTVAPPTVITILPGSHSLVIYRPALPERICIGSDVSRQRAVPALGQFPLSLFSDVLRTVHAIPSRPSSIPSLHTTYVHHLFNPVDLCDVRTQPMVVSTVSIRPKLQVSKWRPLLVMYRQEECIPGDSYQVDNARNSLAVVVCSAWYLTLLGHIQHRSSQARNNSSETGQQLTVLRNNGTSADPIDITAFIEEVEEEDETNSDGTTTSNDEHVVVTENTVENSCSDRSEGYLQRAMVPYGPAPLHSVYISPILPFFLGRTWSTRREIMLACRFVAYGFTKRLSSVSEHAPVDTNAHRHLAVQLHLSLHAYSSAIGTSTARAALSTPHRSITCEDVATSQPVPWSDEDPDKTLCEPDDWVVVAEKPEVPHIPTKNPISSRSLLDEKVTQRIATITLADKIARNFKLDSMWDDCAKSGSASMALLSKSIVRGLVATANLGTSSAELLVSRVEEQMLVVADRNTPEAPSSCETSQSALKATASAFVPVTLRATASIPESAASLKATAAPFVPSLTRQTKEAGGVRSLCDSASAKPVESECGLKASAAAFVPLALKVPSSTGSSDRPSECESTLKPTATPFVPTTLKSAAALPPLASTQLNATAPQFVPLGIRGGPSEHEEGGSSVRMTQAQTTSKSKGRIPHGVRRARKRAKAALALAEAAAEQ